MKDNPVKASLDRISPAPGAEKRMYENILKKSKKQRKISWKVPVLWSAAAAACLMLVLLCLPDAPEPRPQGLVSSGLPPVTQAEMLIPADLGLQPPEGAEQIVCSRPRPRVVRMEFTLGGTRYIWLVTDDPGLNFSPEATVGEPEKAFVRQLADGSWQADLVFDGGKLRILGEQSSSEAELLRQLETFSGFSK